MKSIKKYMMVLAALLTTVSLLSSCGDDKFTESIFDDGEENFDVTTTKGRFEKWLYLNFLVPYNVDFRYKMQDLSAFIDYNMSPPTMQQSIDCAVLSKYLWYDVYSELVGDEFLKKYSPRIIQLIGSSAYDPDNGTEILGLAESGIKINLLKLNYADVDDFDHMNEYVFKTMHHEFCHILHQAITYPTEFNTLSVGAYDASNWQYRLHGVVNSLGIVTNYASSAFREDFAEVFANYITKTDEDWARVLELAARGWESPKTDEDDVDPENVTYYCWYYLKNEELGPDAENNKVYVGNGKGDYNPLTNYYDYGDTEKARLEKRGIIVHAVEDNDGKDGVEIINRKVQIMRQWLQENFGFDLDAVRAEVQKRQKDFDIVALRKQIDEVK